MFLKNDCILYANKYFDQTSDTADYQEISQGASGANMAFNSKRLNMKTQFLSDIIRDESGATAIEYGLIAALLAVVLITALTSLEGSLSGIFENIGGKLDEAIEE
jgi:pilus assembly protein Flp/PilA